MYSYVRIFTVSLVAMSAAAACVPARAGVLIQNPSSLECMALPVMEPLTGPYSLACAPNGLSQWTIDDGHIMSDVYQVLTGGNAKAVCMDISGGIEGDPVVLNACSKTRASQRWTIDRGHVVNSQTTECMSRVEGKGQLITMQDCIFTGAGMKFQVWTLD